MSIDDQEVIQDDLDKLIETIDELIEGRYAKAVFEYYLKSQLMLIRIRTGEKFFGNIHLVNHLSYLQKVKSIL